MLDDGDSHDLDCDVYDPNGGNQDILELHVSKKNNKHFSTACSTNTNLQNLQKNVVL